MEVLLPNQKCKSYERRLRLSSLVLKNMLHINSIKNSNFISNSNKCSYIQNYIRISCIEFSNFTSWYGNWLKVLKDYTKYNTQYIRKIGKYYKQNEIINTEKQWNSKKSTQSVKRCMFPCSYLIIIHVCMYIYYMNEINI